MKDEGKHQHILYENNTTAGYAGRFESPNSLKTKVIPDEKIDFPECTHLSYRSHSNGDSYALKMQKEDQDLGSDAENVPSYCDSIPGQSPLNSLEFLPLFGTTSQNRRGSAPASLFKRTSLRLLSVEENGTELRRRNSSVEERTNHVRVDLEKAFQKEENSYNKDMDIKVKRDEVIFNSKEFLIIDNSNSNDRKLSQKNRKYSVVDVPRDDEKDIRNKKIRHRKYSLPEIVPPHSPKMYNFNDDRLKSIDESYSQKFKRHEEFTKIKKFSAPEIESPMTRRKKGKLEKRSNSLDIDILPGKKNQERKTSITDTLRSVVGSKNKNERKVSSSRMLPSITSENNGNSPNENKKIKWYSLKDRIRNSSADTTSSPKTSRQRNDSNSSAESLTPMSRKKVCENDSRYWHTESAEFDAVSIDSYQISDKESPTDASIDVAKL